MGFPILVGQHIHIESGPSFLCWSWSISNYDNIDGLVHDCSISHTLTFNQIYEHLDTCDKEPMTPRCHRYTPVHFEFDISLYLWDWSQYFAPQITVICVAVRACAIPYHFLIWWRTVRQTMTCCIIMSSNGNIFRITGPLGREFTVHWWIPLTKASDAELWCFLWSASE